MKKFLDVCLWIIGLFFLLCSLGLLLSPEVRGMGIFFALLGITLLPPLRNKINNDINAFITAFCKNYNSENQNQISKKNLIGILKFIIFFVGFIFITISLPQSEISNSDTNDTVQNQEIIQNKYINNPNTKKISNALKIDKASASDIYSTLVDCGINNINWIERINDINNAYFIHLENISEPLKVSFKNNKIEYVFYGSVNLYENGKIIDNISEYIISTKEEQELMLLSRNKIKEYLKYNGEKFINSNVIKIGKDYIVNGSVEAKNAFGISDNNPYSITFNKTEQGFKVIDLRINHKVIFQQKQDTNLSDKDKKTVEDINKALGL